MRHLTDFPCGPLPVRLNLHTRRFFCDAPACPQHLFTERLPTVAAPYARRTLRLTQTLQELAHALGGEPGARISTRLGMAVSGDTLLRALAQKETVSGQTPRVLGVDDWAIRKGHRYGTILVDLERGEVIDLLPDREAETLAAWLTAHPGVEIIARDRAGAYAEGARQGAPDAQQVADRWHLLRNLIEALEAAVAREERAIQQAARPEPAAAPLAPDPAPTLERGEAEAEPAARAARDREQHRERKRAVFETIHRLHSEGHSILAIARQTGKDPRTVRKYLGAAVFPEPKQRQRASGFARFRTYLERRWAEGCHNGAQLWRELKGQGYRGSRSTVRQWLSAWRAPQAPGEPSPGAARARIPAPRSVAWWLSRPSEQLTAEQTAFLERLKQQAPRLELAQSLTLEFFALVRQREGEKLEAWTARVSASGVAELNGFAASLRRDWEAVVAGLTLAWSTGPVEGQINRLKGLKRAMFGRAGLPLLRARVLPLAAPA